MLSIDDLNELINKSKFNQALDIIEMYSDNYEVLLLKSKIYLRKGEYIKAIKNAELIISKTDNISTKIFSIFHKLNASMVLGLYEETDSLFELVDKLIEKIDHSDILYNEIKANYYFTKGNITGERGQLALAIEYHNKASGFAIDGGLNSLYTSILSNIAFYYTLKGELDRASLYFEKTLEMLREVNEPYKYMMALTNLSRLNFQRNNLDKALEYIAETMELLEENPLNFSIIENLLLLIRIYILKGDMNKAKKYNAELKKYKNTVNKREIHYIYMGEALILKNDKRLKIKLKSYSLLKFLIEENIVDIDLSFLAMKNYSELLLDEFRSSNDEEIINEIVKIIYRMYDMAIAQDSYINIIDSLMILSKTRFIQGELEKSIDLLEEAIQISIDNGLITLKLVAEAEFDNLKGIISRWNKNVEISDVMCRLEQSEIINYLKKVSIMKDLV